MRKTTEVMSVKNFMKRNYHKDALGAVLGLCFTASLPLYYCVKFATPVATIAYKALPLIIAL